jgi:recombination protein U
MVSRPIVLDKEDAAAIRNKKSRSRGKEFESIIETACEYYSLRHYAEIEKTPEARQVIGRTGGRKSQMICINAKKAQPDFKGTLNGGRSVVFEAKHTDEGRILASRVTDAQAELLDKHELLGALTFILVSFGMEEFYRIPWYDWKRMKELYGRKYVTPSDLGEYRVREADGVLRFLE